MSVSGLVKRWISRWQERRRAPRVRSETVRAIYWEALPDCSHPVKDISVEGAYIQTAVSWSTGTLIRLNLVFPGSTTASNGDDTFSNLWSRLVRNTPDGFAVEFVFDSPAERRQLKRLLRGLNEEQEYTNHHEKLDEASSQRAGDD
jgi:hypothetical protein